MNGSVHAVTSAPPTSRADRERLLWSQNGVCVSLMTLYRRFIYVYMNRLVLSNFTIFRRDNKIRPFHVNICLLLSFNVCYFYFLGRRTINYPFNRESLIYILGFFESIGIICNLVKCLTIFNHDYTTVFCKPCTWDIITKICFNRFNSSMVVKRTNKSKYISDKLTPSLCMLYVGQQPYNMMLTLR